MSLDIQSIKVDSRVIDRLYKDGSVSTTEVDELNDESLFFILTNESKSALVQWPAQGSTLELIRGKDLNYQGIKPKDAEQTCMMGALQTTKLFVGLGSAGCGKTTLALAYALQMLFRKEYNIVCCKPTVLIGGKSQAIAAITGDIRDKMSPYVESFLVSLRRILGSEADNHIYQFEEENRLTFMPLELARGMQFDRSIIIIDEAQNTSAHSLLSMISRASDSCQLIVLGDHQQVDTGLHFDDTGLGQLINTDAFYSSSIASGIKLKAQYRGELAKFASAVIVELNATGEPEESSAD
jgi:PhoH-like ATPase